MSYDSFDRKSLFAALLASLLLLAGCDKNPLLGHWKLKSGKQSFICTSACKDVMWEKDQVICDGLVMRGSYEVRPDQLVIFRQKDTNLTNQLYGDQAFKVVDSNTYETVAGQCKYGRYL